VAIGFKYRALIKKIFEKHYGPGALVMHIVDTAGNILSMENNFVLDLSTGPADPWLEDILGDCLTAAQGMTFTLTNYATQELSTNTRYALRLRVKDGAAISDPNYNPERWSMPFVTSRYQTFNDHMIDLNAALSKPEVIPALVAGTQTSFAVATDCLNQVLTKTAPGYDDLVELLYKKLFGITGGWLGEEPKAKKTTSAFRIVDGSDTLCIVLEPLEPIFNKPGIIIINSLLPDGNGTIALAGGLILVQDRSGGRILLFKIDAGAVVPLTAPITISIAYDPQQQIPVDARTEFLQSLTNSGFDMNRLQIQSDQLLFYS
jgi:hypothetical protein